MKVNEGVYVSVAQRESILIIKGNFFSAGNEKTPKIILDYHQNKGSSSNSNLAISGKPIITILL